MTERKSTKTTKKYHDLRAQLDELLLKLQDPDCDVDEAAELYEAALKCIAALEQHLQTTEHRIRQVRIDMGEESDAGL